MKPIATGVLYAALLDRLKELQRSIETRPKSGLRHVAAEVKAIVDAYRAIATETPDVETQQKITSGLLPINLAGLTYAKADELRGLSDVRQIVIFGKKEDYAIGRYLSKVLSPMITAGVTVTELP